ncbi:SusC/RagA family TonB-linked outer membrane protein [Elizabethkingia anophelis]|uniref:SusC/RagA family TonB-linked outer membrane protein n=1 Tax=Elizabethkingia anophelis TaxID=1117645 RepID=UPI0021A8DD3E|nr:SusC/RagA family TonB-linked outer membrane protein [Elizabethkingia anophelis]MCT3872330.1 SusC/RagA family TonB-linked outer membrane protein [Elizabethkingia anophelis]MDV3848995.1 SusC/RagA family TonB-linked outer membrane protein [Elizabethkingia anophelis]
MFGNRKLILAAFFFLGMKATLKAQESVHDIIVRDKSTQQPLSNVSIKNTTTGKEIVTDGNGKVAIEVNEVSQTYAISLEGYIAQDIALSSGKLPDSVYLLPETKQLEGVVLTGYTRQSKAKTTGSVSSIKAEVIAKTPVASLDQALQGQVPGLYVASPSGQPGAMGRVTIRGIGSVQDDKTNPLYILDGMPISPEVFAVLNPLDYEDIVVLKDASATAQYGSRGANGVIQITSKKGKNNDKGHSQFFYQNQFGISSVNNQKWDMMNSSQRLEFEEFLQDPNFPGWAYSRKNPYKIVNGQKIAKTDADYTEGDQKLADLRATNTNWRKLLLRNGVTNSHYLSMGGGNQKTNHYSSLSYFKQEGVLPNSGVERFNINSGVNHKSGRFTSSFNLNLTGGQTQLSESDFDVSETNPVASLYFAMPYEKPYDKDGNLTPGVNRFGANALTMYQDISRKEKQLQGVLSSNLSFEITKNLKLTSTLGVNHQQTRFTRIIKPDTYFGSMVDPGEQGLFERINTQKTSYMANFGFNYKKRWGSNEVEAIVLAEFNKYSTNYDGFTGYGLIPGLENTPGGITPGTPDNNFIPKISGGASENILVSQLGMLRYSYANRFTLSGSIRRDGSSRVPTDNRYKYFYAFGATWNIKNEEFLKNWGALSTLRLRLSHGLTGNAGGFASDFGYRQLYKPQHYNGYTAFIPISPGNPNYNWEMNKISDVGLEFGLFKNRIIGEVDLYNRVTSDLFINRSLSMTSGFESIADNMGKIRNRGLEFRLSGDLFRNDNFSWNLGLNLAYNQNRILSLGSENEIVTENYSIHKVGSALGHFYMVRWAGVDPATGAPLYYDKNGAVTKEYNPENAVMVKGAYDPPIKGGITTSFTYKNLQVNALFTFVKGMYRLNTAELYRNSADPNYRIYNQSTDMLNMWQKPGDISQNPGAQYARYMTDRELQSADYIKLRNVSINYKLKDLGSLNKVFKEINIFAQGQNLLTWTKWKGQDPEDDNNWYQYEYPLPRTITLGFNVLF